MQYIMITKWDNHWGYLSGGRTFFTLGMLKGGMNKEKLEDGIDTLFIKKNKLNHTVEKAWKGRVYDFKDTDYKGKLAISFRVTLEYEVFCPLKYNNYSEGWYCEDFEEQVKGGKIGSGEKKVSSERSLKIGNAFSKYTRTGNKSLVEEFTQDEIEIAILQYHLDKGWPHYMAMEKRVVELKEVEERKNKTKNEKKEDDRVNKFILRIKNHPVVAVLIILGIVIVAIGAFFAALDNIIGFVNKYKK